MMKIGLRELALAQECANANSLWRGRPSIIGRFFDLWRDRVVGF